MFIIKVQYFFDTIVLALHSDKSSQKVTQVALQCQECKRLFFSIEVIPVPLNQKLVSLAGAGGCFLFVWLILKVFFLAPKAAKPWSDQNGSRELFFNFFKNPFISERCNWNVRIVERSIILIMMIISAFCCNLLCSHSDWNCVR